MHNFFFDCKFIVQTRKYIIGEGKERIRTTLTIFGSVPLNIPAPPDAKLTPFKNDTFILLILNLDTKER